MPLRSRILRLSRARIHSPHRRNRAEIPRQRRNRNHESPKYWLQVPPRHNVPVTSLSSPATFLQSPSSLFDCRNAFTPSNQPLLYRRAIHLLYSKPQFRLRPVRGKGSSHLEYFSLTPHQLLFCPTWRTPGHRKRSYVSPATRNTQPRTSQKTKQRSTAHHAAWQIGRCPARTRQ